MLIILDANILCKDYLLNKPQTRLLLENLTLLRAVICVPEVVLDEVVNKYCEHIRNNVDTINKVIAEFNALLLHGVASNTHALEHMEQLNKASKLDTEYHKSEYKKYILATFRKHKIKLLNYPTIPHNIIVQRDLSRKLPFKPSGKGYRDCLIWESIKESLNSEIIYGHNEAMFITENFNDFGNDKGISPELIEEIRAPQSVTLYRSIKDFTDKLLSAKLGTIEDINIKLRDNSLENVPVLQWLDENLANALNKSSEKQKILDFIGLPIGMGNLVISNIISIDQFNVSNVRKLTKNETFLSINVETDLQLRTDIDMFDYDKYEVVRSYLGKELEGIFTHKYETVLASISISLILSPKMKSITSCQIENIKPSRRA